MARILERVTLWWNRKRARPKDRRRSDSKAETEEDSHVTWIAAALVILTTIAVIPVGVVVLRSSGATARGTRIVEEEWQGDEAAGGGPTARIREAPVDPSGTPLGYEWAAMPDPREFFSGLIRTVCGVKGEAPEGVKISDSSMQKIRESLLAAFPNAPEDVEVLYMTEAGTSGLFTLKVTDDQGREGIFGVRLVRLKRQDTPWEVESFVVIQPPE